MNLSFTKTKYFHQHVHPILARLPFYAAFLLKRKSYLKDTGWFRTFKSGKSVDLSGKPVPWFTYGAIEILKERLPEDAIVFEYGCGLGTMWWANHAHKVDAVEDNRKWYETISKGLPENVRLQLKTLKEGFINAVSESGEAYDVIIIDGYDGESRIKCAKAAIPHLSERGIIIYDDTDRPKQTDAIPLFTKKGFKHLPFVGFSPIGFMKCETTIFYKEGNLLNL